MQYENSPCYKCGSNDTVELNIIKQRIQCRKCNLIHSFHYFTGEDEVRNYEDDEDKQNSRATYHNSKIPMFQDFDDKIQLGDEDETKYLSAKDKYFSEKEMNFEKIKKQIHTWVTRKLKFEEEKYAELAQGIFTQLIKKQKFLKEKSFKQKTNQQEENQEEFSKYSFGAKEMQIFASIAIVYAIGEFHPDEDTQFIKEKVAKKLKKHDAINLEDMQKMHDHVSQEFNLYREYAQQRDFLALALNNKQNFDFDNQEQQVLKELAKFINQYSLYDSEYEQTKADALSYLIFKTSTNYVGNDIQFVFSVKENTLRKYLKNHLKETIKQLISESQILASYFQHSTGQLSLQKLLQSL